MAADPDGELVVAIARGDARAAKTLVDRHLQKMIAVSRRMLGNSDEAEDVAQDVFMRVWSHAGQWRPGAAKFETWMHRVAINLCYDRLRRRRETPLEDAPEPIDVTARPSKAMEDRDLARVVNAALQDLPERQRAAIVLCHYQERSNIEAAQIMDLTVEALESLLSRGRRTLRERLKATAADMLAEE